MAAPWLHDFEIVAPGVLSLQSISHVTETPLGCVRAPCKRQGWLGDVLIPGAEDCWS